MSKKFLKFNNVSYEYENASRDIFSGITFQISNGWTGVIGANGSGKTTLLKLACGLIIKNRGSIEAPLNHYYVEQRTDEAPFNFGELLNSNDKYSFQLINSPAHTPGMDKPLEYSFTRREKKDSNRMRTFQTSRSARY